MSRSTDAEIEAALANLPAWHRDGDEIRSEFRGPGLSTAIALVDAVASRAEAAGHHPDIDIRYDHVTFVLSTHSEGGLTGNDFALAGKIDDAAAAVSARPLG